MATDMPARLDHAPLISRRGLLLGSAALLAAAALPRGAGADDLNEGWLATAGIGEGFAAIGLDPSFAPTP